MDASLRDVLNLFLASEILQERTWKVVKETTGLPCKKCEFVLLAIDGHKN